uniref:Citramalyl-CoA lyase, mitochondrial n=1 Tax=Photinus pyralis TaxID=7054 RepID=A0A1Y1NGF2_PHOPY
MKMKFRTVFNCIKKINIISVRYYTPRRALMYVPGDNLRKLSKAFTLDVDCIAMDCEDGVALSQKETARSTIRSILDTEKNVTRRNFDRAVRVNPVDSEFCHDDLRAVLTAKYLPDTVLLPKVEDKGHLEWFADQANALIRDEAKIDLIIYVESALAVIKCYELCKYTMELAENGKFRLAGVVFGSDDLCASLGITRSHDGAELLYARQKVVLISKAFNLQAIDMVHIDFKDLVKLKEYCEQGAQMGYTGKQVIHPDQVPVVQTAFLPNKKQVEWATGLLESFKEHQKKGQGAFVYKGIMIDMPTMKQAQNIVDILKLTSSSL